MRFSGLLPVLAVVLLVALLLAPLARAEAAVIGGVKFQDTNADGVRNPGEPGLAGWSIRVYDQPTGALIGTATTTDTSGALGSWGLGASPGRYRVCEVLQAGWAQTFPTPEPLPGRTACLAADEGPVGWDVTVTSGDVFGLDFGNRQPVIIGFKFQDTNGDGALNPGEPSLAGWSIRVYDQVTGALVGTAATSDTSGALGVWGLSVGPGRYRVCEVLQAGWAQTFPTPAPLLGRPACLAADEGPVGWDVIVTSGDVFGLDFGNFLLTNRAPTANAGADQSVDEGALVILDGSASSDPDGDPLTYAWTQIGGPAVVLSLPDPVRPTFTAPSVGSGGATLTFQLSVSDGLLSDVGTVNVTVKNVNKTPMAVAIVLGSPEDPARVNEGSLVTLDGSQSFDPDDEPLAFSWLQIGGPAVTLSTSNAAQTSFRAPSVGIAGAILTFQLTVTDGLASATDTVSVVVDNVNHAPTADAGVDQTVSEGRLVTMAGSATDPDGDPLMVSWLQIGGQPVVLSGANTLTPTFMAPAVGPSGDNLVFRLTVDDGAGGTATDDVTVVVQNVNDPPLCGRAAPSPALLWPPNHKLLPGAILGVTDPGNDRVTITITGVTQDEPVTGLGEGDTSPDAVIQGATVLLRAERSALGDGRAYRVSFLADDGQGGQCTGSVDVGVPHDMKAGRSLIDSGQLYNSTQP